MVSGDAGRDRMRIVFLDRATVRADIGLPAMPLNHDLVEHARTEPDQVVARLAGAQIAIVNKVRIGDAELAALPDLRMIAVAATGLDNIDLDACARHGVHVANVRDYANHSAPEHAFALILSLARGLHVYRAQVAQGAWSAAGQFCFHSQPITDLAGATLGIVGTGSHGTAVGRIAQAFGMRVLHAERKGASGIRAGRTPFDDVLSQADVLSLHCPLTPDTHHLLSDREFDLMARRPILINVARGALIDAPALVRAVDRGAVSAVGLDVLSVEPPPVDHPLLALAGRPNVVITPHVAWASAGAMRALMAAVADNITRFVQSS